MFTGGQAGIGTLLCIPCQDSPVSPWGTGTQVCLFCLEAPLRQMPRAGGIQDEGRSWGVQGEDAGWEPMWQVDEHMGWQCRRMGVKIKPGLCHSHSELVVPEMLPLTSSHGSNTNPDSKHLCERPRGVPRLLVLYQLKAAALISVPWAALDKLGPDPPTQALCLAPELWFQALLGV